MKPFGIQNIRNYVKSHFIYELWNHLESKTSEIMWTVTLYMSYETIWNPKHQKLREQSLYIWVMTPFGIQNIWVIKPFWIQNIRNYVNSHFIYMSYDTIWNPKHQKLCEQSLYIWVMKPFGIQNIRNYVNSHFLWVMTPFGIQNIRKLREQSLHMSYEPFGIENLGFAWKCHLLKRAQRQIMQSTSICLPTRTLTNKVVQFKVSARKSLLKVFF